MESNIGKAKESPIMTAAAIMRDYKAKELLGKSAYLNINREGEKRKGEK